jgi:hypothetical protein
MLGELVDVLSSPFLQDLRLPEPRVHMGETVSR